VVKNKISIITHEYYPVLSGGTVFAEKLAQEWAKDNYEVEILTCGIGRDFKKYERTPTHTIVRFFTGRTSAHDATLKEHVLFVLWGLPQFLFYLLLHRSSFLFSIFAIPSGFMATIISKLLFIPHVVFVDAADVPGAESAMQGVVKYLSLPLKFATRYADGVTICEGMENLALPLIDNKNVIAIPNGTVIPSEIAMLGSDSERARFLSIGRLVLRKGFAEIIEALSLVKQQRDDFVLNVIGYGTREEEIHAAISEYGIEEHIDMVGRVEYDKLKNYYLNSDAYIFYGGQEGSSLAMVEAVSYGLPIIASDHPGNREYIEHGESGFLVEHHNPKELADTILNILENRKLWSKWGKQSRKIGLTYSWESVAERYLSFFKEVSPETFRAPDHNV
jgi:glycosyltransferase involved in cell wall biosynthesis